MKSLTKRALAITPTQIRLVSSLAKASSLHLGIGQPDLPFPDAVRDSLRDFAAQQHAPYTPNAGSDALRYAIASYDDQTHVKKEEVLVSTGVQEAMALVLFSLLEEGDEALIPDPAFPAYSNLIKASGAVPLTYKLSSTWQLDFDDLAAKVSSRTKVLVVNSPGNPTGVALDPASLRTLETFCFERNIRIISDEIYSKFVYKKAEHQSFLPYIHHGHIVLNGLSKTAAMMGFRVGWVVASADFISAITPLHQHLVTSASSISQAAAIAAIKNMESNTIPQQMESRFDFALKEAKYFAKSQKIDTPIVADSAFYIMVPLSNISERALDDLSFAKAFLKASDVVTIPGCGFGAGGRGYLRIAYTAPEDILKEAFSRLNDFYPSFVSG